MRPDGTRVKDLPPIVAAVPYIMPKRYDAWNSITEYIDEEAIKSYIREKRRSGVRINHMAVIIAAYYKAIQTNPKLNYFVVNSHIYRRNHFSVSFVILKKLADGSPDETTLKIYLEPGDTVFTIQQKITDAIEANRHTEQKNSTDKFARMMFSVPGLPKFVVWLAYHLDKHGLLPRKIISQFFVYIVYYFVQNGFTLGLNIVNMIFLFLGLLLHGDLRRYVDAIGDAAAGAAGILLQFPFYAGIMGMMVAANDQGVSLAGVISQFFVDISNNVTFPMLSFLAAGIVNFFVPSGGGQWAVQGPIMMPAGAEMNIAAGRTAMAIAWGDQWTNMIQPFWALPALGIAKLSARDIMGYLVVILLFTGAVACLGFLGWALFF